MIHPTMGIRFTLAAAFLVSACSAMPQHATDDVFARIERGMSKEEVRRLAGSPHESMPFPRLGQDSWAWYAWDSFGYYSLYSVTFGPDARVVSKFARRLNDGGNHQ